MSEYRLLIDGELAAGAASMDVVNPATGEVFARAPKADAAQLEQAVAAARAAFPAWSARAIGERRELLEALAAAVDARLPEFAELLTREQGKPLAQARTEVSMTAYTVRALSAMPLEPRVVKEDDNSRVLEFRRPLGVVAAITPWNFPLLLLVQKLAPALLAGNTMVVKPAPTTPLTTLLLGELCAGIFSPGVVNVITDQNELGALLTSHPQVDKVSFTGSTATGRKVLASAADSLKRITLELGGNDAALVLDDVDVQAVAAQVYNAATYNAGQICVAVKRVYVPAALYDEFCAELARLAAAAVVGDGMEPATQVGPLQNRAQFEKVKGLLAAAGAQGRVIAGGEPLDAPGYFVPPTVVRDLAPDALIVTEEQFAPILPVVRYDDLDAAIAQVNASAYGLGGSVWSADTQRAAEVAQRLDSGSLWVNSHMALDPAVPFRGAKQSGMGVELGEEGLYEYTQARVLTVPKS